jgi:acyl transferase domain-containing protein/acyl carrier protein
VSERLKQLAGMSQKRLALLALELQDKLAAMEQAQAEPVAIVGMACRFPGGGDTPDAFWRFLRAGGDGVIEVPRDRWDLDRYYDPDPEAPGKMYMRHGAFLRDIDRFDPHLFGIAPREAASMDPQQRLLLEACWEALEDAARPPTSLSGSPTGVFVGITTNDYGQLVGSAGIAALDAYAMTGNALNFAAGRISYVLGLQGPSLSVDTACSSSLVAIHLACDSLRSGDSSMAIAAGVNLILRPEPNVILSRARMLARDGRCKTFDAAADGYVRGEGCGAIVLKRLSDAIADRDRVLAVIRGSAVNQDGPSGGLTVPNGPAQQALLREALRRARVEPADVDYVEAHGTGTALGDPIEARALGAVFGAGRGADRPLQIGAVKTNIGHLESAAGIAGIIKVVLALQHGEVPPHLHLQRVNADIDLDAIPARIPTAIEPWPAHRGTRIAGVSSFGASGTNAHIVLEQARLPERQPSGVERPRHVLALSARTADALRAMVRRYADHTATAPVDVADLCFTANTGRTHFAHRLAVPVDSMEQLHNTLIAAASGGAAPAAVEGVAAGRRPSVALAFPGQGAQIAGMGRELYATQPTFRTVIDQCAAILDRQLDVSLIDLLHGAGGKRLAETAYTQPALFAIEYALAVLWRAWGVQPAVVFGHSIGEYVAACVAGVFGLEDALTLVAARGRLMQELPRDGGMLAVTASVEAVAALVAPHAGLVSVAAINAPDQIVLAGASVALQSIARQLEARGINVTPLTVSHAFHSPLLEPMLDEFERIAAGISYRAPQIPVISNLTGAVVTGDDLVSAGYWRRHARSTVRFAASVDTLAALGIGLCVEAGPKSTLAALGARCRDDVSWVPSLQPPQSEWATVTDTLCRLYVAGVPIDWSAFDRDYPRSKVALPTYPFQRQRYWVDLPETASASHPDASGVDAVDVADWMYALVWEPLPAPPDATARPCDVGTWLLLADDRPAALAARIERDGGRALWVKPSSTYQRGADGAVELDPADPDQIARLLRESLAGDERLGGVVIAAAANPCAGLLHIVQLIARRQLREFRIVVMTRGAQAPVPDARIASPDESPLWGLCRTLTAEHPEIRTACIDLDPDQPPDLAAAWELVLTSAEGQLAIRRKTVYAARLARQSLGLANETPTIRDDRTYVVTGGYGGLGLRIVQALAASGAKHFALVGRRGPGETARAAIGALERGGVQVSVLAADIANTDECAAVIRRIGSTMPPIAGLVHAAGVLDDGVLLQQTWERFERVLAPKVSGTWNLHRLTAELPLDFFVMFSSATSLVGNPGQANYAAANAFLDAFAHYRRGLGLPALTINWGPWAEVGMGAGGVESARQRWRATGVRPIAPDLGAAAFERLLASNVPQAAVLSIDWSAFLDAFPAGAVPPVFARFVASTAAPRSGADAPSLPARVADAPPIERPRVVHEYVRDQAAKVLGLGDTFVFEPHQGLRDVGLDSLMAIELRNALQRALGKPLPATLAFDCPTIEALSERVLAELGVDQPHTVARAANLDAPTARPHDDDEADAIAVIGLGCRFPGGAINPQAFWDRLRNGFDAVVDVPRDRWDIDAYYDPDRDAPGKMYTRRGAFLDRVDLFDPQFFGIAPREAASLDPQQRLLLEVSWEALEYAGVAADSLIGSRTGVFVGICGSEYALRQMRAPEQQDLYFGTGNALSAAAGRLSYVLGLQGPSLSIDTACSSSLAAVHLACQSLKRRESAMALAGGVNVLLAPELTVNFCRARMMAADGRCKTFDASADGYVRGEGAGIVVLKRLGDARRDGDRVLAVIAGSAINQDGRSSGLTVPNGPAQQALLQEALESAHLLPADVQYVEAHGTGTPLGDPIEVQAVGAVFGRGREAADPLLIGSVKTNIGHLEAAAGIAGLIKVVLALQHGEIPPHLHFATPNPNIAWEQLPVRVATGRSPWLANGATRAAGVSSFGFTGTNVHVIVTDAAPDAIAAPVGADRSRHLLTLSARTADGLRALADGYAAALAERDDTSLADVCYTANTGRAALSHRLTVGASSIPELRDTLGAVARGELPAQAVRGRFEGALPPKVAFLFSGQGAQRANMGRALYETQPAFKASLDRSAAILDRELDVPLLDLLYGGAADRLNETAYTQPTLFAVEYALAELWRGWGIEPSILLGHSIGEYVAACVAGVFSLEDALKLVVARGRLMQALPRGGGMLAVQSSEAVVAPMVLEHADRLSIAAVNGPEQVVVAGAAELLKGLAAGLASRGIEATPLAVSHAFHSPLLEPMLDAFERLACEVTYRAPQLPVVSNVSGRLATGDDLVTATYWRRHARAAVRFADGVETLVAAGIAQAIEVGPSPTLSSLARRIAPEAVAWLPSLRPAQDDWTTLTDTIGRLYVGGAPVDFAALDRAYPRKKVSLPTYPFQRQRCWLELPTAGAPAARPFLHPLLGPRVRSPLLGAGTVYQAAIDRSRLPFLADHRVGGSVIAPAAVFVELALAAARQTFGSGRAVSLRNFAIEQSLVLSGDDRTVQIVLTGGNDGEASFEIVSTSADAADDGWVKHAAGALVMGTEPQPGLAPLAAIRERCGNRVEHGDYYAVLDQRGFEMGPLFRAVEGVSIGSAESLADLALDERLARSAADYFVHPVLLDAACQTAGAAVPSDPGESYMVVGFDRFACYARPGSRMTAHATSRSATTAPAGVLVADVRLFDGAGECVAAIDGLAFRKISEAALARMSTLAIAPLLYAVSWQPKPLAATATLVPALPVITERAERDAEESLRDPRLAEMAAALPLVDAISTRYVLGAVQQLGWRPKVGECSSASSLQARLGVIDRHARLFARMLDILAEDGLLTRTGDLWHVARAPEDGQEPDAAGRELKQRYPESTAIVELVSRCGAALARVLTGDADPLDLLFPGGSFDSVERIYERSAGSRLFNRLVQTTVESVVDRLGADGELRVLEIGAGTGATSASILPGLPAARTRYVFTDLSPMFFSRAAEKFRAYPFVEYRRLDIERDPAEQGFAGEQFDIIVAANVLHATRDLGETIAHAAQLLAPDGLLVIVEATGASRWLDITFGLTDGWWRFEDRALRASHPLLRPRAWTALLESHGFAETAVLPPGAADGAAQAVILGRGVRPRVDRTEIASDRARSWLVLADVGGVGDRLAEEFQRRGDRTRVLRRESADELMQSVAGVSGVIHLWSLDSTDAASPSSIDGNQLASSGALLRTVQALLAGGVVAPVWVVTRRAQPAGVASGRLSVSQSAIWGLGRVVALEHPELWGGLIDLDSDDAAAGASAVLEEMLANDGEDQVARRGPDRLVARLLPASVPPHAAVPLRGDAAYLVTGGLGRLGLKVAKWLAERGAGHLVLIGRRSPDQRQREAIAAIEAIGAAVHAVAADVAEAREMSALFGRFGTEWPALRGVVHAATDHGAALLREMSIDALSSMLRPKVAGASVLDSLTRDVALDFFVLFSSTTGLLGSAGLGHYAAANSFLDALAHDRRAQGFSAVAINWGAWDEMRVSTDDDRRRISQGGLLPLPSPTALQAFGMLLQGPPPQITVASVDWPVLKAVYEARRRRPFLERLGGRSAKREAAPVQQAAGLVARLEAARPNDRRDVLIDFVRRAAGAVLGLAAADVDVDRGLFDMGMDSLMSVDLKSRLEAGSGQPMPSTLAFNYPTVTAIATYFEKQLADLFAPAAEPAATTPYVDAVEDDELSEDELMALLADKLTRVQ